MVKTAVNRKTDSRTLSQLSTPQRYSMRNCRGLHLWVTNGGHKYWIFRYSLNGKRKETSLGTFPIVTLEHAISKVVDFKRKLLDGEVPKRKRNVINSQIPIFEVFAKSYIEQVKSSWTNQKHYHDWCNSLQMHAYPFIGNKHLDQITTRDVLDLILPIWTTKHETATRVLGRIHKILAAAITLGHRSAQNPALFKHHLENLLPKVKPQVRHHHALSYRDVPQLMSELHEKPTISSLALQFTILTACRTNEVLAAHKSEINGDVWVIPPNRTKTRITHAVPLGKHCLEILCAASKLSPPTSNFIFASHDGQQLSNMSMLMMLRRLRPNYTVHGFRSSFKDWAVEQTDYPSELSEQALGHTVGNQVERAYRRTNQLEKRRILMSEWSDFIFHLT